MAKQAYKGNIRSKTPSAENIDTYLNDPTLTRVRIELLVLVFPYTHFGDLHRDVKSAHVLLFEGKMAL